MEKQQKWIRLFEQVIGRKPSPQEFLAGKDCGFDLKQIKSIAGMDTASQIPVSVVSQTLVDSTTVSETVPVSEPIPTETPMSTYAKQTQIPLKQPMSSEKKKRLILRGIVVAVVLALAGGYYYMDQQTGADVAADKFLTAIKKEDYSGLATQFSRQDEKWKQADAKEFIQYLENQINIETEIEKMSQDPNYIYRDDKGNKLIGMKKISDIFGFFPSYQVVTYPVEIFAQTNIDSLVLDKQKLPKEESVSLGKTTLLSKKYRLSGKTDLGEINTEIVADARKAEDNELHLSLNSVEKQLKASLPEDMTDISEETLFVNGKEVGKKLDVAVKVLDNQTLLVHSQFKYEGATYTTEKVEITAEPKENTISVALELSKETTSKIAAARKVKTEKEEQVKKEKETEATIKTFMNQYIEAMRSSIYQRVNNFAKYYDTNSSAYKTMDNYVTGGGVAKNNIDYQTTLDYTVTDISKEGSDYAVTVHNKFKEVYMNGKSSIVEKNQVFKLRPEGDSFLIYAISEY
ncbi:TcaA NTF2-like domain-containing protein [Streptococcus merionis]|uniref:TcaA NTF2-like domain-containing protein n=1 Tax=Streptococcus merionis TaxID=400065 RepID=UPI003513C0D2